MDSDFHKIYNFEGKRINENRTITIKDNVWIGNNSIILKGTSIYNNIVIGAGSVILGILDIENSVYAGNPAKPVKYNINWEY